MIDSNIENELNELENSLKEIKNISKNLEISSENEIIEAQEKLDKIKEKAYTNLSAWEKMNIARDLNRPTALDYIDEIFDEFIELHGDRFYRDDKSIVCEIGNIGKKYFTIIAQQKGRNTKENIERNFGMPNPEAYRKAQRLMKQAEKFKRPIITFIDTKGAYPGIEAEERGQGEAIAKSMMEMSLLKVPIIVIVIGEGSSGGALAISIGDKILMLENSVYSILSPEGFASILWKDSSRAKEASEIMKMTAQDLYDFGIVDSIIKEPLGGASKDKKMVAENIKKEILKNLKELEKLDTEKLVENRYQKFRNIGEYSK